LQDAEAKIAGFAGGRHTGRAQQMEQDWVAQHEQAKSPKAGAQ